jgi:phage regulator Rha-like protein
MALRANEIDKRDSERLAKHFEQVKNGLMVVVDKNELEFESP